MKQCNSILIFLSVYRMLGTCNDTPWATSAFSPLMATTFATKRTGAAISRTSCSLYGMNKDEDLLEEEEEAAWDAHDLSDPGMEAAAEERAVMLAHELARSSLNKKPSPKNTWNEEHLIHGAINIHEDTPEELREDEDEAAWDAHNLSDAGMEAAAEERAVMLAQEYAHKMRQKAIEREIQQDFKDL